MVNCMHLADKKFLLHKKLTMIFLLFYKIKCLVSININNIKKSIIKVFKLF